MGIDLTSAPGALFDFLLPAMCRHCGRPIGGGEWSPLLCRECAADLPLHGAAVDAPPPVAGAWALALFDGPARRLLIDLKYEGVLRVGRVLGARMALDEAGATVLRDAHVVVPVPLHWRRRWARGHNQAAVLARSLCRSRRQLAFCPALRRCRATPPQVGLPRSRRLGNVAGAFMPRRRYRDRLDGRTVVVIDDVITTGATIAAAARALIHAGAAEVRAYAAAWAPD